MFCSEEVEIQQLVALMTGWKMAINSAVPCFVILFFGAWSDRHNRRKPCILVPLCGQIMMAFSLLLCVYFEDSPIEMAIFVEVFFPSITGSPLFCMSVCACVFRFAASPRLTIKHCTVMHCRQSFHHDGWFLQLHCRYNHRERANSTYRHH